MKKIKGKNNNDHILCVSERIPMPNLHKPGERVWYTGKHSFYYRPASGGEPVFLYSVERYSPSILSFFQRNGRLVCDEDTSVTYTMTLGQLYRANIHRYNCVMDKLFDQLSYQINYVIRYELEDPEPARREKIIPLDRDELDAA